MTYLIGGTWVWALSSNSSTQWINCTYSPGRPWRPENKTILEKGICQHAFENRRGKIERKNLGLSDLPRAPVPIFTQGDWIHMLGPLSSFEVTKGKMAVIDKVHIKPIYRSFVFLNRTKLCEIFILTPYYYVFIWSYPPETYTITSTYLCLDSCNINRFCFNYGRSPSFGFLSLVKLSWELWWRHSEQLKHDKEVPQLYRIWLYV